MKLTTASNRTLRSAKCIPPHSGEDARLVGDLLAADGGAIAALFRREHASMLRYARLFVTNRASAEEVVQDAWVAALAGLERFEGRSSLRNWIFGIVANCARMSVVREARSVPLSALADRDGPCELESDRVFELGSPHAGLWMRPAEPSPEERLIQAQTLAFVRDSIKRLPELRREVITLRDMKGWSAEDTCAVLGITGCNQRVLLHRARSRVRAELGRGR